MRTKRRLPREEFICKRCGKKQTLTKDKMKAKQVNICWYCLSKGEVAPMEKAEEDKNVQNKES